METEEEVAFHPTLQTHQQVNEGPKPFIVVRGAEVDARRPRDGSAGTLQPQDVLRNMTEHGGWGVNLHALWAWETAGSSSGRQRETAGGDGKYREVSAECV